METKVEIIEFEKMEVHPTIDFKDKAYFGFWVNNVKVDNREKESAYLVISSDHEVFPVYRDSKGRRIMKGFSFKLKFVPDKLSNNPCWSRGDIKNFLEGASDIGDINIFELTKEKLKEYVDFPNEPRDYDLLSLWIIGTYFFSLFEAYPYIYFGGFKRSGKTRTMTTVVLLSFNGLFCSNISMPSIYRIIEQHKCTLGVDETEFLVSKKAGEIRNVLNAGYLRGSKVVRQEKKGQYGFYTKEFDNYSPKVLVNIAGLEDVLADRTIEIIMEKSVGDITKKELKIDSKEWQHIKNYYYLFVMKNWKLIKGIYEKLDVQANIRGRDLQMWKPILSLAKWFSLDLYNSMLEFALEKIESKEKEEMESAIELGLLEVLVLNIEETGPYRLTDMIEWMSDRFHGGDTPKWLSSRFISRLLKKFGFTRKSRDSSGLTTVEISIDRLVHLAEKFINIKYLAQLLKEGKIKSVPYFQGIASLSSFASVSSEDNEDTEDKTQNRGTDLKKGKKHDFEEVEK